MNENSFFNIRDIVSLAGIIVFAIVVRTILLGLDPLYIDEGYSVWYSSQDWGYLWTKVPEFETHPPFYYSVLKIWRSAFGSDEASLRLLSVLLSILLIPLIYLSARLLDRSERGRTLALLAALLAAGWPFQIRYAQEARPYAFLAFAMALTMLCLVWIIQNPKRLHVFPLQIIRHDRLAMLSLLGLGVGLALLLWLHNLSVGLVGLVGLFLLFWWARFNRFSWPVFQSLLAVAVFSAVLYSPNIQNLFIQITMVSDNFWVEVPTRAVLAKSIIELYGVPLWWEVSGSTFLRANFAMTVIGLLAGLIGFRKICFDQQQMESVKANFLLLIILLFGPVIISLLLTYYHKPIFLPRTLITVQIPLMIILAAAPWAFPKPFRTAFIGIIVAMALTVAPVLQWKKMTGKLNNERSYPVIVNNILQSDYPEAPVLIVPNTVALPVTYYMNRLEAKMNLYPLPESYPVLDGDYAYPAGVRGAAAMTVAAVENVLHEIEPTPVIWVISRKNDLFDPSGHVQYVLEKNWPCREIILGDGMARLSLLHYSTNEECPLER